VFRALDGVLFDIRIEDQGPLARLLREGVVLGAVTTERTPVPGCRVQPLGVMRYIPGGKSYLREAVYLPGGFTAHAVAEATSLAWNRYDAHPDMLIRKAFRRAIAGPRHYVPTAERYGAAVRAGLGWGMYPEQLAEAALADGSFVRISDVHLDVPLFWQCWKLDSLIIARITDTVRSAAADLRRRPRKTS
jgi:LysR family transcriptional regulator, chromosome initiation inhibitor